MNIEVRVRPPLRRWQQRLIGILRTSGHDVWCVAGADGKGVPIGVSPLLALEQRLFGPAASLFDPVPPVERSTGAPADLVIALDGEPVFGARAIEPLFDGATGDAALLAMLSHGAPPRVRIRAIEHGVAQDVVSAILAVEDRKVLSRALDQVLARLVTLLAQAVRRVEDDHLRPVAPSQFSEAQQGDAETPSIRPSPLSRMARGLAQKVRGQLPWATRGPNHWRIGYRRVSGAGVLGAGVSRAGVAGSRAWPTEPFIILPDDGARFYADPMPFEHDGRTYLFFEDFPYAESKGVIGMVEIAVDGTASPPRTVLEQPCHLSYPLIVEHAGEIYMLPEMSAAKRLQLFRADPFPDRWVPDRILLEDVVVADATPVKHEGIWWLFATLSDDGGSSWDQLGLFHAPDLFGPWTAHADNPVLVDAGAGRPAGPLWHENGALMRVAQDCRGGYGLSLAICRVDRLDPEGYAQTVVARLVAPEGTESDGVHTLARAGTLEVIDLRHPRRPAVRRAPGNG